MTPRRVRPESHCPALRGAYHHWFVTHHTRDWKRLQCTCGSCGRKAWMSDHEYAQIDELREAYWLARAAERAAEVLERIERRRGATRS